MSGVCFSDDDETCFLAPNVFGNADAKSLNILALGIYQKHVNNSMV
jgi:hypothetical protein